MAWSIAQLQDLARDLYGGDLVALRDDLERKQHDPILARHHNDIVADLATLNDHLAGRAARHLAGSVGRRRRERRHPTT